MSFTIRAAALISILALAIGAAFLGGFIPELAGAQAWNGPTSQIVITTKPGVGFSSLPNSSVTVSASGPTLGTTPSSIGTLTYATDFTNDTKVVTVIPGPYTITAAPSGGYAAVYSSGCSGEALTGQTQVCTIIAAPYTDNSARLSVSVNVNNTYNGGLIAGSVQLSVSGTNPSPAVFNGSISGTVVALGPGSFTVNAPQIAGYTSSLSGSCSGTIASGDLRSCTVTYSNSNYNPYGYTGGLVCVPPNQNAALGATVSFQAYGGTGTYTWKTADRTYPNIGPVLTTSLQTGGPQSVVVTSGAQNAICTVNVSGIYAYSAPTYTQGGAYTYSAPTYPVQGQGGVSVYSGPTYSRGGYVLAASTGPGYPNTGFEPIDWAGLVLAVLALGFSVLYFVWYAPKLFLTR